MSSSPRMLVAFTLATALVVGGVIALATGAWWALAVALLLHIAGTAFVMFFIGSRMRQGDKPDPLTEARIEAEHAAERSGGERHDEEDRRLVI